MVMPVLRRGWRGGTRLNEIVARLTRGTAVANGTHSPDLLEEMKADLVSLFAARELHERGAFDDARLRAVYADGIRRVLQKTRPRRDQPYQTMQLIQWNWFLDHGLLTAERGRLRRHASGSAIPPRHHLRHMHAAQRDLDCHVASFASSAMASHDRRHMRPRSLIASCCAPSHGHRQSCSRGQAAMRSLPAIASTRTLPASTSGFAAVKNVNVACTAPTVWRHYAACSACVPRPPRCRR